jgi:tetratricopeptide (TPR) repeat protein
MLTFETSRRMPRSLCLWALVVLNSLPRGAWGQQTPRGGAPNAAFSSALGAANATDYATAEKALSAVGGADRPAALVALGRVLFEQGRFAEADRCASQAVSHGGGPRLTGLALRAELLAAQGKVDDAIRLLEPSKDAPGLGGRRVRLELGELLIRAGRRSDAEPLLLKFADEYGSDQISANDPEGLAMVGRAMHLLRHVKDANRAFNESERGDLAASGASGGEPDAGGATHGTQRVETLLWRADLYIDNYDPGHAEAVLSEALKIAPHKADTLVALARVKLEETFDFGEAERLVRDALAVNPKHTGAFAVRAGIALRDMSLDRAESAIDAGLAVDPNNLELLSMRAATRFLADDKPGFEAAKRAVFARNKEYSRAFGIIGEYAEWEHRYDDVIGMMKEATLLDPTDHKAWAQLGLMQTRAGNETDGLKSLEEAWKGDHFNVRVYNTLEMLYGRWIPQQYDEAQEGIFKLRYPKDERALLERYVPRMLGEAWGAMKIHYMFAPTTPVAIELYRQRQHFSVRTSGLPNIGIEGVCFGHVVAAMSPNSDSFNWGNVLWHELAHVFAIQLSKNHVPRWFTEGLSEYETMIRRPEWQRELDPELYQALKRGLLPGVLDMNRAFTHAEGDLDVTVAYYAASQMVAFTAEEFGFPRITRALELWGEGRRTGEVIRDAFAMSPDEYDARFRAWALARLSRYEGQYMFAVKPVPLEDARAALTANPASAAAHVALALALIHAHRAGDAAHEIDEALRASPGDPDAHFVAAKLAAMNKDTATQERHLSAIRAGGGDGYAVRMELAEVAKARKGDGAQRAELEAAHRFDPTQVEPLRALYDLAVSEKRESDALASLREIARLDQHDRRAYKLLLEKLIASHRWDEAKRVGEAGLYLDLLSAAPHVGYARALSALGDHESAAFELESALLCKAPAPETATAHALLAHERFVLGDASAARMHRDRALKLDPENAEARALKL